MSFLLNSHACAGWGGEMAQRIRAFDWSSTALGAIDTWSNSLCTNVQMLLASPVPLVMLWDHPGYMIYNDAYAEFAGGRHPYLLGTPVELGWPEVADFNRNIMTVCLGGGTLVYKKKDLILLRNGKPEEVWLDLSYSPVSDDSGKPAGVIAIVMETTSHVVSERQREQAEADFHAADERLQLALNAGALLGSFVWDVANDQLSGDERFARTFSYPLEQPLDDLPIADANAVIHPDDFPRVLRMVQYTLEQGGPYNAEYRIRRADGEYTWVQASGRCEFDSDGKPLRFPGLIFDIHERKVAEESLLHLTRTLEQRVEAEVLARSEAEARLRQAQKLEAIGGLTGGVAHDFNNLLQVIAANLHLLARQEPDNANVQRRLNSALAAVERGAKLSSQLLAFARQQPLSPAVYSLRSLYDGLGDLLQRALGEMIQVDLQLTADPCSVHLDRNQLENALLNLALNARDAMLGEGTLRIYADNVALDDAFCEGKEIAPGDYVHLSIADSGSGMSAEVLGHAFEPFFSTKPSGHGTGLGLSMVFGFVKQSGGHIDMVSEVGAGTTVNLYFPRSSAAETVPPAAQAGDEPSAGGETILVVEDNPDVRCTVDELLQQLGYSVLLAANGDAAMDVLQSGAQVDLIFTDVVMPGTVKSADLAVWAKQQKPAVPVLFTSGHTRDIISRNHQLTPDIHLLSKPYGPQALMDMLKTVLSA
ncbi:MAG: PAS domain-containing protein [Pseudomonas sp.]|uniref:PAS domain-containing protein n=1 Tax=Pseudomonas sp. TaxID=306 RepID=UPI0030EFFD0D